MSSNNDVKKKKQKESNSHPPYFQMIKEAILALHERNGSSPYAIAKHIKENHKGVLPSNYKKILGVQLKNFVAKGKLVKVKASFKLSEDGKKEGKPIKEKKETREKKEGVGEKKSKAKKNVNKSEKSKKKKAASLKAKQPKTIKSPMMKKKTMKAEA